MITLSKINLSQKTETDNEYLKERIKLMKTIQDLEDQIIQKLMEMYADSLTTEGSSYTGNKMLLLLYPDGTLYKTGTMTSNTIPYDVWNGNAKVIASIEFTNVLDCNVASKEEFYSIYKKEKEDEHWTENPHFKEYIENCREFLIQEYAEEWAKDKYDMFLRNLKDI